LNVCQYLLENQQGESTLLSLEKSYSHTALSEAAGAIARFLVESGGLKGDRAILIAPNDFFWVAAYLGILQAGLVCVPLHRRFSAPEMKAILESVEAKFAFVDHGSLARVLPELAEATVLCDRRTRLQNGSELPAFEDIIESGGGEFRFADLNADDLAALMFTSGTTDVPKGVMISVRNIIANTNSIIKYLALDSSDRIMAVLPFHYCFGASLLHTYLRAGGSIVMDSRFMYPDQVLARMIETRCTGFAGVPSHFQILLRRSNIRRMKFPDLRTVQQAGGHLAPAFVNELRQVLPTAKIFLMYGQTEATARLSYLAPEVIGTKIGSVGKAIAGVTLSVIDEAGRSVAPGEVGEIVAEGENVSSGYWRDANETSKYFRNGKLYTGDLATLDGEGFIYIVDRTKDYLKCRGERVSCRFIEDQLLDSELLVEAAVIGIPDAVMGEAAKAFVVLRDRNLELWEEQVREHCRLRLPLHLIPKEIIALRSMPKNDSGKVMKHVLRDSSTGTKWK
jgi:long-chain acyl-CoA synthetase